MQAELFAATLEDLIVGVDVFRTQLAGADHLFHFVEVGLEARDREIGDAEVALPFIEDALGSPETDSMIDNGRATNALSLEDRNCRVMRRAGAAIRVDARDQVFALREIAFCEFI